jgi:hypothetical protein
MRLSTSVGSLRRTLTREWNGKDGTFRKWDYMSRQTCINTIKIETTHVGLTNEMHQSRDVLFREEPSFKGANDPLAFKTRERWSRTVKTSTPMREQLFK